MCPRFANTVHPGPQKSFTAVRQRAAVFFAAIAVVFLGACRSDDAARSGDGRDREDPFAPRASVRVGEVAWVGPENRQAVVVLDSASLPIEGALVSVDFRGQMSGVLLPARFRSGTSVGMSVEQGRPQPGHVAYLPGSAPIPGPGERLSAQ
ncbi:MAG: hypothetical protein ACFB20_05135 [Opitutales bacterium]